jgi:predicted 2-oxoglutarate/Fe(II)-dependent dioxygenase YbiX
MTSEELIADFSGALSEEECRALIHVSEAAGFAPAIIEGKLDGPFGFTALEGRNNHRAAIDDLQLSLTLWNRIARCAPATFANRRVAGLNERLRFYRYDAGQSFGPHTDGCYERATGERSLLTVMIYLNADFAGGETYFLQSEKLIAPETGKALLFSHHLLHEGRPVTRGRKYILRTDVMYE